MPAPSNQQNPRQRAPDSTPASTTPSVGEVNGRVDQLALVQQALLNMATPTMIAGFAMVIAQMQSQAAYPDVLLTIFSSIGPLELSASFRDGTCHCYDLTNDLLDPRSHMLYGEPSRPPMDQESSLRDYPLAMQPPIHVSPPLQSQTHIPAPPVEPTRFSCTQPVATPPILTPPMPLASEGKRLLTQPSTIFMLPSTFQGGGVQVNAIANNTIQNGKQTQESRPARTVTFQDSYDVLTPSSSKHEPTRNEPSRLVGFQKDPKLQERQRQQQRVENKTTKAPTDLRDKLIAGNRASDLGNRRVQKQTEESQLLLLPTRSQKTKSGKRMAYFSRNTTARYNGKRRSASPT